MGLKIYSSILDSCEGVAERIENALRSTPADNICGVVCCGVSDTVGYHQLLGRLYFAKQLMIPSGIINCLAK